MDRFLSLTEVTDLTGLSPSTIARLEKVGRFPQRRRLSPGRVGWSAGALANWVAARERGIEYSREEIVHGA